MGNPEPNRLDPDPTSSPFRAPAGMAWIPGGMKSSDEPYPEENPIYPVAVDGFWMDTTPVTNWQFNQFVDATGYVTFAERAPNGTDYPGARTEILQAGSLVFTAPQGVVDLRNSLPWWRFEFGASWRHPYGPRSSIAGLADHPVVHVTYRDVEAYAHWRGKQIPTEAEWEFAARAGLDGAEYARGDELMQHERRMANSWQGLFPHETQRRYIGSRTSHVRSFPPNAYGLFDMIGNVWEWTADWYGATLELPGPSASYSPWTNLRGDREDGSYDRCQPDIRIPRKILKGGSHPCAANYCRGHRPAPRHAERVDTSTSHVGFRCVITVRND
jgi:formylglycine-generating enzyme required for sulfatase activity